MIFSGGVAGFSAAAVVVLAASAAAPAAMNCLRVKAVFMVKEGRGFKGGIGAGRNG